jgi:DNA-binding HxlR family transcriptional regulator
MIRTYKRLAKQAVRGAMPGQREHEAQATVACGDDAGPHECQAGHAEATWPEVMCLLDVLQRRWDLAVLENVSMVAGIRPSKLLSRINAQSTRPLSWKVLAETLGRLVDTGYVIRRPDGHGTRYWLKPPGVHAVIAVRMLRDWHAEHELSCTMTNVLLRKGRQPSYG